MELYEPSNGDGELDDDEDYGSAETQELEGLVYRFVQIVPEACIDMLGKAVAQGIDHPVVILCDVDDPMGLAIARKFSSQKRIQYAIDMTTGLEGMRPGIYFWQDLNYLKDREPSMYGAIRARMERLVLGYFPIVVVAGGGYNAFPWPIPLKEKSKLNLFQG